MTSLISWIGADQRGAASIYLASDSRITWLSGGSWDRARKLFISRQYPHLLGYCGEVLFPTQTIGQIVELIDLGFLLDIEGDADACIERITAVLSRSFNSYPASERRSFQMLYATRKDSGMRSQFQLRLISFDQNLKQKVEVITIPQKSGFLSAMGSGASAVRSHLQKWQSSSVGGTSRAIFSAFSDALKQEADPQTAGPPQLTGLYRTGGGKTFGVLWQGNRYFYGTELQSHSLMETVQWHNELFEICDPRTLNRKLGAQPQPRPSSLK